MHDIHAPAFSGTVGIGSESRCNAMCFRRRTRMRSWNPSNRYKRRTRLRFKQPALPPQQPPDPLIAEPRSGEAWARSRMGAGGPVSNQSCQGSIGRPGQTVLSGRPANNSPRRCPETSGPVHGSGRAVDCFSQGLRQHGLVEREILHPSSGIFLFHQPQLGRVRSCPDAHTSFSRYRRSASLPPSCRHSSPIGVPRSACRMV
jgi:hypothetical protein